MIVRVSDLITHKHHKTRSRIVNDRDLHRLWLKTLTKGLLTAAGAFLVSFFVKADVVTGRIVGLTSTNSRPLSFSALVISTPALSASSTTSWRIFSSVCQSKVMGSFAETIEVGFDRPLELSCIRTDSNLNDVEQASGQYETLWENVQTTQSTLYGVEGIEILRHPASAIVPVASLALTARRHSSGEDKGGAVNTLAIDDDLHFKRFQRKSTPLPELGPISGRQQRGYVQGNG